MRAVPSENGPVCRLCSSLDRNRQTALAYTNGLVIDGAGATLEVRRAASGARLYGYTTGGPIYGAPSVAYGRIYAGSMDGKVYAFAEGGRR